jgi:hypothetical protein
VGVRVAPGGRGPREPGRRYLGRAHRSKDDPAPGGSSLGPGFRRGGFHCKPSKRAPSPSGDGSPERSRGACYRYRAPISCTSSLMPGVIVAANGRALEVDALRRRRLQLDDQLHQGVEVLRQFLGWEGAFPIRAAMNEEPAMGECHSNPVITPSER